MEPIRCDFPGSAGVPPTADFNACKIPSGRDARAPGSPIRCCGKMLRTCIVAWRPVAVPGSALEPLVAAVMSASRHVTVMRCPRCGELDAGAATRCRNCGNEALDRTEVPGRGRLVSWTVVRRPAGAFAHRDAFAVALVDLDAGPRLTGNLEGWECEPPLGAAVRVIGEIDGIPLFAAEISSEIPSP